MNFFKKLEKSFSKHLDGNVAKYTGGNLIFEELVFALKKEIALSVKKIQNTEVASDLYVFALNSDEYRDLNILNSANKNKLKNISIKILATNKWKLLSDLKINFLEDKSLKKGQYRLISQISKSNNIDLGKILENSEVNISPLKNAYNDHSIKIVNLENYIEKEINNFPILFGRSSFADILIKDEQVSRVHSQITVDNNLFYLSDLNSLNGTFLNDKKISKQLLSDGDIITIGNSNYQLFI